MSIDPNESRIDLTRLSGERLAELRAERQEQLDWHKGRAAETQGKEHRYHTRVAKQSQGEVDAITTEQERRKKC